MFSDYLLYAHNGSSDHNQEAIIRATANILDVKKEELFIMSANKEQDLSYGIDELSDNIFEPIVPKYSSMDYLKYITKQKLLKKISLPLPFSAEDIDKMSNVDIAISVGGDNYCYEGFSDTLAQFNNFFNLKSIKTVLWGCSINPALLENQSIIKDLKNYSLITARETETYKALLNAGIKANLKFCPDPTFTLKTEMLTLPKGFDKDKTIGINISCNLATTDEQLKNTIKCVKKLIDFIIQNTSMQVALIPYSINIENDDVTLLKMLYKDIPEKDRVVFIDDCTCSELKGFISRCTMFIGSNLGAEISAYSCCVPSVAIGDSISIKGIVHDIFGTTNGYLINPQDLSDDETLINAMKFLVMNFNKIKNHLKKSMPIYCSEALKASKYVSDVLESFSE